MKERINLVPRQALSHKLKRLTPIIIGVMVMLSVSFIFFMGRQLDGKVEVQEASVKHLQDRKDNLGSQQIITQQLSGAVENLRSQGKELEKKVAHLAAIPTHKQRFSELLLAVSRIIPPTVRCEKILLTGNSGQISGKATVYRDLPAFVQNLGGIPRFRSVSLHVLNHEEEKGVDVLAFSIVFQLARQK